MAKKDSWFTDYDIYLFAEGTHYHSYEKLGAHFAQQNGQHGVHFSVWAPNAKRVSVVGDFNNWDELASSMLAVGDTGLWECFIPGAVAGQAYKYSIHSNFNEAHLLKADPYAFYAEVPPRSASVVWDTSGYDWNDSGWMQGRGEKHRVDQPISIYEVHLGSWKRKGDNGQVYLSYRELAEELPGYVKDMGYSHVEFMPIMEYPFDGSWGYQPLGYFAPTSRYGTPQDFMYLVDKLHEAGIGVITDWVPGHFPCDGHGLGFFDGTHLYEHADRRQGFHPDWETYIFNFGRTEVANFLISSALFWLEKYHVDALRVDAVASLLYLDYSREEGEWIPNVFGGRENLEAIAFLKHFNELVYERHPDIMTIAEESTAWPMVSKPTYIGGLGFGYKWNMGWMNDNLAYMSKDPIYRSFHHNNLTFGFLYSFQENFILPLSHDEVVHGKGSLLRQMAGDDWQKFANLRLLFGWQTGHPGKKLHFMGDEFAQWDEWWYAKSLDWHLLQYEPHEGMRRWVRDLNNTLRREPGLFQIDFEPRGFTWIDCHDSAQSVLSFVRHGYHWEDDVLCVFNFTPVPRLNYHVGTPREGFWEELLNSDAAYYGGSGLGNFGGQHAENIPAHGYPCSLSLTLPPLAALFFRLSRG